MNVETYRKKLDKFNLTMLYLGKWIVRLRKGLASRCWENLIMAMLGEQFMVGEEVCGAVVSIRYQVRLTFSNSKMFHIGAQFVILLYIQYSYHDLTSFSCSLLSLSY